MVKVTFFFYLAVWLHQTRIGLSLYDVAGQGYLRESVRIINTTVCNLSPSPLSG